VIIVKHILGRLFPGQNFNLQPDDKIVKKNLCEE